MIELSRRSGIVIPKIYENESWYHLVRAHLFRKQKQYNSPDFVTYKFFSESEKSLVIPRYFPIHDYVDCKIIDNSHEGEDISINHNITPRNAAQEDTIKFMLTNDHGMIKLNPGMGKTVISIYTIAERKKKALVLVHRNSLDIQWRERLFQFTNLTENKVSVLNSNKFEEQLLNSSVIIATAQTITSLLNRRRMEYLVALNRANIGIFIADETHTTVGAPTFSQCSLHVPAKYCYGLSATPNRSDGNSDIITYHLGKEFSIDSDDDTMPADVTFILADFGIDTPYRHSYLHWEGSFQKSRYLNIMKNSKIFMDLTKALMNKLVKDERELLIICERVKKLIDILYKDLKFKDKSKFIAGSPLKNLNSKVTFSTPGKIRDGIDAPHKDALLITSPVKNIEQLCGRITRSKPNKKMPIVIDMVDIGSEDIRTSFWGRLDYYNKKGWKVNFIYINPITYEKFKIKEEDAFTIINGG